MNRLLGTVSTTPNEIPKFRYHVSNEAIDFDKNYVMSIIELEGVMFEAIPLNQLENDFDTLNLIYAETAKEYAGRLAFWTFQKRRKINVDNKYDFTNIFTRTFMSKYMQRFNTTDYYENKFYIAIVVKYDDTPDLAVDEIAEVVAKFSRTLFTYKPRTLSVYENEFGVLMSEVYEFLGDIVSSEKPINGIPLTGTPVYENLPSSTLHFGYDILQSKGERGDRFATLYDLKDFPSRTKLGMFNEASLSVPAEYNLVQSFTTLSPTKSFEKIEKHLNKLRSAKDKAVHQLDELEHAQGYIQSGELAFGEYHASLVVFGDTPKDAIQNGMLVSSSFTNHAGAVFRRANLSSPATYFSQLPTYRIKPRPMLKSSRNLAGTFSMQTYSRGKATGNVLGDGTAVMPLETKSKTLYDFNFHFTNDDEENIGDDVAGHTLLMGATGTGKTTTQSALLSATQRFNPAMFVLDKDRGMNIFIRALDGDYFDIKAGVPTGINPFQFPNTPQLREFLNELVISCATDADKTCSSEEQNQIKNAVDTVLSLPHEQRRFSAIIQSLPKRGGNELYQRLLKWCRTDEQEGRFAWALDNPTNNFDVDNFKIVGFDVSDLLVDNYQPSEPVFSCLFYMKNMMLKKHPILATVIEEFWLPIKYEMPSRMILDSLKTGRKMGEFILLISQSPADAIKSPIFNAIVEQTPTKIMLPNPDAEYKNEDGSGYSRIGLTEKEFDVLHKLGLSSRTFLVKQGNQSAFAMLDLYGFNDEIAVLSSSKKNVDLLDKLLNLMGQDTKAEQWLPVFYKALNIRKQTGNVDFESIIPVTVSHVDDSISQEEIV